MLFKKIAVLFFSVMLFWLLLNAILDNVYTHRFLESNFNAYLKENFQINLKFEVIRPSLIPLGADLYGVNLSQSDSKEIFFQSARIRVHVSILSIMLAKPKLTLVELTAPDLDITSIRSIAQNQKFAIPWPPKEFKLEEVRILDGALKIFSKIDEDNSLYFGVFGLNLGMNMNDWTSGDIHLESHNVNFSMSDRPIIFGARMTCDLSLRSEALSSQLCTLKNEDLEIRGPIHMNLQKMRTQDNQIYVSGIDFNSELDLLTGVSVIGAVLNTDKNGGQIGGKTSINGFVSFNDSKKSIFSILGDVTSTAGRLGGFQLFNSQAEVYIDSEGVSFDEVKLIINDKKYADLKGYIPFASQEKFQFSGKINDLSLFDLMKGLEVNFDIFDANLSSGNFLLSGISEPLTIDLNADIELKNVAFRDLDLKELPTCDTKAHFTFTDSQFVFHPSVGRCKEMNEKFDLNYEGYIKYDDDLRIKFSSDRFPLNLVSSLIDQDVSGSGKIAVEIFGKDQVDVSLDGDFKNVEVNQKSVGVLNFKSLIKDKTLNVQTLKYGKQGEFLEVHKSSWNFESNIFNAKIKGESLSKSTVDAFLKILKIEDLGFQIDDIDGDFSGSFHDISRIIGNLQLGISHIVDHGKKLDQNLQLDIESRDQILNIKKCNLLSESLDIICTLKLKKSGSSQKKFVFDLRADDQIDWRIHSISKKNTDHLGNLPFVGRFFSQLEANLDMKLKITGPIDRLEGFYDMNLTRLKVFGSKMPGFNVHGLMEHSKATTFVTQTGGSVSGRVIIDFVKDLPFEWFLNFFQFDLRSLLTPVFYQDPRNFAFFEGEWKMKGSLLNWWKADGEILIQDLRASYQPQKSKLPLSLFLTEDTKISMHKGVWQGGELKLDGEFLSLKALLGRSFLPTNINLKIIGDCQIDTIASLVPGVEKGEGNFQFDLNVNGPLENVRWEANAKSNDSDENLNLFIPEFSPELRNLQFDVSMNSSSINIHKFEAKKGRGSLKGYGEIYWSEHASKDSQFHLQFDQASLLYNVPFLKTFDSVISGSLVLTGNKRPFLISGDVEIMKSRSLRNFDIRDELVKAFQKSRLSASPRMNELPWVSFDVFIKSREGIAIYNRNLKLNLSSNLHLLGNNEKIKLDGNLETSQGRFSYKRDFKIVRAAVSFNDPVRLDPDIDVMAFSDIAQYRLWITVSGRASEPIVEMIVDPSTRDDGTPISRLDAIVLLSRGSLPLKDKQSFQTQNVGVSEAINIYASQLPFDKIIEASGQDYLQPYIDSTTDERGAPVPQLNLPIRFSDRLEALLRKTPTKTSVSIEVPIHEGISFSGNQTSFSKESESVQDNENERSSLDLKFRFSLK